MEEQIGNLAPKKIRKGKSKPALFISVGILVAAICMIVASVICLPRDKIIKTKGGNVVEVIAFENGGLLYAASDGTVAVMNEKRNVEKVYNIVSAVGERVGFGKGILRKFYKDADSDNYWGLISVTDGESSTWLFKATENGENFIIDDAVIFTGDADSVNFLERGGYLFALCSGQQIASLTRFSVNDLSAPTLGTKLYKCSQDDDDKIKLEAIKMAVGVDCMDSDGEYIYVLYDGGFLRISFDFSTEIYDESKGRSYLVDNIDTSKYFYFNLDGVSSRGGAFVEESGKFFVVAQDEYIHTFDVSEINYLEVGETMECSRVRGAYLQSTPAAHKSVFYDKRTKKAYILHESSKDVTRADLKTGKTELTASVKFDISRIVQGKSANDLYYLYTDKYETGASGRNILGFTDILRKLTEKTFKELLTTGICVGLVALTVVIILTVIVVGHKQEQAVKIVKKIFRQKFIYLAMLPSLILLVIFCYYEAIASIRLSFYDYTLENPSMIWNNFANYKEVFSSAKSGEAFGNMALFLAFDLFVAIGPPLLFAFFLSVMKLEKLSNAVRTLLFITGVVPSVAGMLIWKTGIYDTEYGALNFIIKSLGGKPVDFLGSTAYAKWSVLLMGFPFVGGYLIFYGGMMNIPSSYYEAAELEGIGIWKRLFYIDIPLIVPQLKYIFIMSFIHSLQNFARVFTTTSGYHGTATPIVIMYQNMLSHNYGLASAYATVIFVLLFFATFLNLRKQKRSLED